MTTADIIRYRLRNQQIASTKCKNPQEIVSWMAAMQAQEFAMAKWAIGLRLPCLPDRQAARKTGLSHWNDFDIERAFNKGDILRTHLMRPTWHFVSPADIRWMLALTAPRVNAINAYWYRKFELDNKIFKRSNDTLIKALEGGKQLTRKALKMALEHVKIIADGLRLGYIMMHAELDGVICSGVLQGRQFTYALLEERAVKTKTVNRQEALVQFAFRYFTSRGPASLQDFAYWSGLTLKDVTEGAAMLPPQFIREKFDGQDYIFEPATRDKKEKLQTTFLMPVYDEYGMGYKNRSASLGNIKRELNRGYNNFIVVDGVLKGGWKRTQKGNAIVVETFPFAPFNKKQSREVDDAVIRYRSFMNKATEKENGKE